MSKAESKLKAQTELWRYMDVARFLALIDRKELYLPRLHELQNEDASEGAASPSDPDFRGDPEYMQRGAEHLASSLPLVSCWHENEGESVAMWKLYVSGREGVAIKTTVSSLIQLLSVGRELKLGRVVYRDINDFEHSPDIFIFEDGRCKGNTDILPIERNVVFRKNTGYTHEQEVRAVIYDTYCGGEAILNTTQLHNLQALSLGQQPERCPGVNVRVDVALLIQGIVVSPTFPSWAIKSLQKAVDAAFFPAPPIEVKPSVLLDKRTIGKKPLDQVASAR
jgi:hypothetical protein